jgi:hypothetical protein
MARTIAEIQLEMDAAYEAAFGLSPNQVSNAGLWKLLRGVIVLAIYTLEVMFDKYKLEVTELAASLEFGNFKWWKTKILEFQFGDPLVEDEGKLYYLTVDPSKQIIKKCSVIEQNGVLQLKIAGESAGELVKITDGGQMAAIEAYVQDIKPAGVFTQVVSNDPDSLAFVINIAFDGKLVQSEIQTLVINKIKSYLKEIDFDSLFKVNKFRDALESLDGVQDVFINQVKYKAPGEVDYINLPLNANHQPISGYYKHIEVDSVLTFQVI